MARLEIHLFGALSIARDGQPIARLPSRRVKDLLSYLVIARDTRHSRHHLAGIFWGDQEDQKARHCLNTTLWRLNKVLGQAGPGAAPYLQVDAHTLGFNRQSDVWIDVVEFESRCLLAEQVGAHSPDQQSALYREAVSYYTDDLLTDCYDDWCMIERERLHRLYIRALGRLMSYHAARGQHEAAIDYGRLILVQESLHEDIHRELIQIHLAAGDPSGALRQYRECEAVLRRELGVAPMPETQILLRAILSGMTAADGSSGRVASGPAPSPDAHDLLQRAREALAGFDAARQQLELALEALERLVSVPAIQPQPVGLPRTVELVGIGSPDESCAGILPGA